MTVTLPAAAAAAAADPEYIALHPLTTAQCTAVDSTRRWRCSRIYGHTQPWHQCWDIAGRTLGTWEDAA